MCRERAQEDGARVAQGEEQQRDPGEGQGTLGRPRGACAAGQAQPAAPALSPLRGRPWRALPSSLLSESHSSRALRGANGALAAALRLSVCLAGHQRKDCRAAWGVGSDDEAARGPPPQRTSDRPLLPTPARLSGCYSGSAPKPPWLPR